MVKKKTAVEAEPELAYRWWSKVVFGLTGGARLSRPRGGTSGLGGCRPRTSGLWVTIRNEESGLLDKQMLGVYSTAVIS